MKQLIIILFLQISFFAYSQNSKTNSAGREKININREWKFKLGDYAGAEAEDYVDNDWSNINLPHNFSIPYFQSAQWYTGYGWYRKYFDVPAKWKSKRIFIEFEGAFRDARISLGDPDHRKNVSGQHHRADGRRRAAGNRGGQYMA